MAYMDKNGDGKVTLAEAPADVKTAFSFIDKNGDGGIDVMEAQVMVDFGNKTQSQSPQEAVTTDSRAEPAPTNDQPADPVVEDAERPQSDPPSSDRSGLDHYRVITEQNLFRKLGWAKPKPGNPFQLVGIVSRSTGARALLARQGSDMAVYATAGEDIGAGWTLVSIDRHSVKIRGEEMGERTLDLDRSVVGSSAGSGPERQRKGDGRTSGGPSTQASSDRPTAAQLMSFMDKNGDGRITMDEAPDDLKKGFAYVDKDGDGGIDVDEAQVMVDYNKNNQSQ